MKQWAIGVIRAEKVATEETGTHWRLSGATVSVNPGSEWCATLRSSARCATRGSGEGLVPLRRETVGLVGRRGVRRHRAPSDRQDRGGGPYVRGRATWQAGRHGGWPCVTPG